MTVSDIYKQIKACIDPIAICKICFTYQQYEEFFFPISVSPNLFLGVAERDFRLDGFTVRRLSDITSIEAIKGTYLKIHYSEGNISRLSRPPVSIDNWQGVFKSMLTSDEIISIEGNAPNTDTKYFLIGRVLAVGEQAIRFRAFDGAGNWSDKALTVPYSSLHSLTFGSSYITTYSKYIKPYPEIKSTVNR